MVAVDGRQRTVRHPSRMRATKGSNIVPEASDQQRHSRPSAPNGSNIRTAEPSVNRNDTNTVPTATKLRQSGTQSSRGNIVGNLMNRKKRTKELGTAPPGQTGTNRQPTTSTDESMKQNGADVYGSDRLLPGRYNLLGRTNARTTVRRCSSTVGISTVLRMLNTSTGCTTTRTSRSHLPPVTAVMRPASRHCQ